MHLKLAVYTLSFDIAMCVIPNLLTGISLLAAGARIFDLLSRDFTPHHVIGEMRMECATDPVNIDHGFALTHNTPTGIEIVIYLMTIAVNTGNGETGVVVYRPDQLIVGTIEPKPGLRNHVAVRIVTIGRGFTGDGGAQRIVVEMIEGIKACAFILRLAAQRIIADIDAIAIGLYHRDDPVFSVVSGFGLQISSH